MATSDAQLEFLTWVCLHNVSKTIKNLKFSEILMPNIGLIDPGTLCNLTHLKRYQVLADM